jgi:hypothetical protein
MAIITVTSTDVTQEIYGPVIHYSYFGNCEWHYFRGDTKNILTDLPGVVTSLNAIPITDDCYKVKKCT